MLLAGLALLEADFLHDLAIYLHAAGEASRAKALLEQAIREMDTETSQPAALYLHIGLGKSADLLVVAPATANTLAKLASGQADNLVTITALALRCPLLIAPAMDAGMFEHPATQANLALLRERPFSILIADLKMPGIGGLDVLNEVRLIDPQVVAIATFTQ